MRWSMQPGSGVHAARFVAETRKLGIEVAGDVDARHWKRLREAFGGCVAEREKAALNPSLADGDSSRRSE